MSDWNLENYLWEVTNPDFFSFKNLPPKLHCICFKIAYLNTYYVVDMNEIMRLKNNKWITSRSTQDTDKERALEIFPGKCN